MPGGTGGLTLLILAAGASSRMRGRDKLLEPVRGRPLLADRVAMASKVTPALDILVALPSEAPARWQALEGTHARLLPVDHPERGLSESLKTGLAALGPDTRGLMVMPADMPDITAEDLTTLIAAFDGKTLLRGASANAQPGHPVLFPSRYFAKVAQAKGDEGGRSLLKSAPVTLVQLPGNHAITDLDTPEDWAAWRANQRG